MHGTAIALLQQCNTLHQDGETDRGMFLPHILDFMERHHFRCNHQAKEDFSEKAESLFLEELEKKPGEGVLPCNTLHLTCQTCQLLFLTFRCFSFYVSFLLFLPVAPRCPPFSFDFYFIFNKVICASKYRIISSFLLHCTEQHLSIQHCRCSKRFGSKL